MKTLKWNDRIDPATIPDEVLYSEVGRRRVAQRVVVVPGTGRPPKLRPCPDCGEILSARDMRAHRCGL